MEQTDAPPPHSDNAVLNLAIAELIGWTYEDADKVIASLPFDPDFCRDPAAALGLLEHVVKIYPITVRCIEYNPSFTFRVRLSWSNSTIAEFVGDHPVFETAIAYACRDALIALQGDRDDGTD